MRGGPLSDVHCRVSCATSNKRIELVHAAYDVASRFLGSDADAQHRFSRVSRLVEGFESPFGLELLATVHRLIRHEGVTSKDAAVALTHQWNDRKKRFTPRQIGLAYEHLMKQGWLGGDEIDRSSA